MSKSVLVIDTPESCRSCYLRGFTLALQYCKVESEHIKDTSVKPDWCPLKPLPEKNTIENGMTDYQCGMIDGEHRQAIPKTDIRNNGHNKCCNKLAVYEDLEEQGLLVRLPCKVGDTVYVPTRNFISELRIIMVSVYMHDTYFRWILNSGIYPNLDGFPGSKLGKTLFLTCEEAEKKLEEMKNA